MLLHSYSILFARASLGEEEKCREPQRFASNYHIKTLNTEIYSCLMIFTETKSNKNSKIQLHLPLLSVQTKL